MNKIKQRVDEYLGFDSDLIFKSDHIRLFGGAVRDILANDEINDLDILLGSISCKKISKILELNGFESVEEYVSRDINEMYKDIKIISEPQTFMKIDGSRIKKIQLIRPAYDHRDIEDSIKKVIWNVDLTCCAVSWDGENLYENYPNAVSDCLSKTFLTLTSSKMHNSNRNYQRRAKLLDRGWLDKNTIDAQRRSRLEFLIPDEKVEYIKEYNEIIDPEPKYNHKLYI
jgi:hypothetical protein